MADPARAIRQAVARALRTDTNSCYDDDCSGCQVNLELIEMVVREFIEESPDAG